MWRTNSSTKIKILYHVYKRIHVLKHLKDQGCMLLKVVFSCTGSRHFVPGVTAGGIQKTNTQSPCCFLTIRSMELFTGCYEDHPTHTNLCTKSDWSHFPPSSLWVVTGFYWNPIALGSLFEHAIKILRTSFFLIAAPTVTVKRENKTTGSC